MKRLQVAVKTGTDDTEVVAQQADTVQDTDEASDKTCWPACCPKPGDSARPAVTRTERKGDTPADMQTAVNTSHIAENKGFTPIRPEGLEPTTLGSEDRCSIH